MEVAVNFDVIWALNKFAQDVEIVDVIFLTAARC